ncbi:MAG: hypothetical protein ACJ74Z_10990 [Bryobacteraceae bacterium]
MTNPHMPAIGSTSEYTQQWTWIVHCPDCLTTKSLGPEDFDGDAKIVLKCTT